MREWTCKPLHLYDHVNLAEKIHIGCCKLSATDLLTSRNNRNPVDVEISATGANFRTTGLLRLGQGGSPALNAGERPNNSQQEWTVRELMSEPSAS
jgi:hypothetical protein